MSRKVKRLTRKDKSNAEMFEKSAATRVSAVVSFGIGLALTVLFYVIMLPFRDVYIGQLFYERGFVQYVLMLLTFWAIAILAIKMRKIKIQKEAMHFNLLLDELSYEIDGENVEQFEDHIWSLKIKHN